MSGCRYVKYGLLLLSMAAMAGVAHAGTIVSDDGVVIDATAMETGASVVPSSAGTGRGAIENLSAEGVMLASVPMSELLTYRPMTASVGIESILGFDSRVRVYTNRFPQRAIGLITFGTSRCTGWLIGANTVVTAGHCVAQGGSNRFYDRTTYRFYAGRNGSSSPYGVCTVKALWTSSTWLSTGNDQYDWGALKLNCTVGNTVGTFGFFYTGSSLLNEPTVISGYPGDKPLDQWQSVDKVRVNQTKRLFYKNDTIGGMSGSPVFSDRPPGAPYASNGVYAMGIHTYGVYNGLPFSTHNHATRIDQALFNSLVSIRNQP